MPGDSWAAYLHERNEIFDFIRDRKIEGVVCISGDSHMGELNCIPRSEVGGYDIYDLCSSPLAQMPAAKNLVQVPEMRVRDVWTRSVNVGVMRFEMGDTAAPDLHALRCLGRKGLEAAGVDAGRPAQWRAQLGPARRPEGAGAVEALQGAAAAIMGTTPLSRPRRLRTTSAR